MVDGVLLGIGYEQSHHATQERQANEIFSTWDSEHPIQNNRDSSLYVDLCSFDYF